MSADLLQVWFHEQLVPRVEKYLAISGLPRKAILLIDNAPSHAGFLENGDICVEFLLPNIASLVQPMDQGVLEILKRNYNRFLLQSILQECNDFRSLTDC
jgi:hypothetical protein